MRKILVLLSIVIFVSFARCDNSSQTSSQYLVPTSQPQYVHQEQSPKKEAASQNNAKEVLVLDVVDCTKCKGRETSFCSYCNGQDLTKQTCQYCNGKDLTKETCQYCYGKDLTRETCQYCYGRDLTKERCTYCYGSGAREEGGRCIMCRGTGRQSTCVMCRGTGRQSRCVMCRGTGHQSICAMCRGTGHQSTCVMCRGGSNQKCLNCEGYGFLVSSSIIDRTHLPGVAENRSYYGELNENGIPKTVYVRGYYRKDGSYVGSYYRAPPTSNYISKNTQAYTPSVAENGSYKGEISEATGRPKTVHVDGYYRKDGTYVKGHYRSSPSRRK